MISKNQQLMDRHGNPVKDGSHIAFSAGFHLLTGDVVSVSTGTDGTVLQVQTAPGVVQPVSPGKVLWSS